jgi:hypothetical protein
LVDIKNYNYAVSVHTDAGEAGKKLSFMTQVFALAPPFWHE